MIELGSRERNQPPPPHIVWESLADPRRPGGRQWLDLRPGEVEPRVLRAVEPELVVWSSLWPDRPGDEIRFDIRPAPNGCALRWTLLTPGEAPGQDVIGHLRHRLNFLINGRLRYSFGQ
ncbi:SRPBCC domain-containing protein [Microbispora sp. NPDC049125]|uniref:SRPBCC family protein n=1 Tax=Microbispora sp. NPDC049125 TaxID=3154929 RepID=UPI003465682B